MKRLLILSLFVIGIVCFAGNSWAGEASFYDPAESWILRAYTEGSQAPYTVKLEIRDIVSNSLISAASVAGMDANPKTIATDATSPDVSLSFDPQTATAYIFYTTSQGLQLAPVSDLVYVRSGISASPSSLAFGSVNVNTSSDRTVSVSNTGGSPVTFGTISVTGAAFARNGGTCSTTLNAGANCTVIVRFTPTSAGGFSGSLFIPSSLNNLTVPLSGTGVVQSGNIDLVITSFSAPKSADNNVPFTISVTIANTGGSAAGAFKVKGYFSEDQIPGVPPDKLLFTWDVASLNAGSSLSKTQSVSFSGVGIHKSYYIVIKVDSDDQIVESNEGNNIVLRQTYVSR